MSLGTPLAEPIYEGTSVSFLVPGKYPVALGGHPYLLDDESDQHGHQTIPQIRQQSDTSDRPGESSLNPEGLWRRAFDDWSHGAGQLHNDRPDSDPARFRSSKGIDPWAKWQLSLLHDTETKRATVAVNIQVLPVGGYLYVVDGNDVYWTADPTVAAPAWTSSVIHVAEGPQSVKAICSDGKTVWAALGSNGIHQTIRGAAVSSHFSDLSATLVDYVKGRLMAANGNSIYNVIASGAAPSALFTHPNTDFSWVGFAEGKGHIYAAGYSGDKSLVYRTAVKPDGTALEVPVVAGELTDGEIVRSIDAYLGFVLIGTDHGVRFAQADDNGDLTMGALVKTGGPVYCFEGQDRFVWFGWTDYDDASTGLGRLDLRTFLDGQVPAYASDLMATGQGAIQSACTFGDRRYFAIAGVGVYGETAEMVPQGTLDSGLISYGLPDDKVAMWFDVRTEPLSGSIRAYLSTDRAAFVVVGTDITSGSTGGQPFPTGQAQGELFETRLELNRSNLEPTAGPVTGRLTLFANPVSESGIFITAPLLLSDVDALPGGQEEPRNPRVELTYIRSLRSARNVVTWQEGSDSYSVTVEDFRWLPHHRTEDGTAWQGTCVVKLKTLEV